MLIFLRWMCPVPAAVCSLPALLHAKQTHLLVFPCATLAMQEFSARCQSTGYKKGQMPPFWLGSLAVRCHGPLVTQACAAQTFLSLHPLPRLQPCRLSWRSARRPRASPPTPRCVPGRVPPRCRGLAVGPPLSPHLSRRLPLVLQPGSPPSRCALSPEHRWRRT